jgi:hypothetical protein
MPAYSSEGILWGDSRQVFTLPTPPFQGRPEVAFGVAVNGVPFDPAAGEWWAPPNNRVQYETDWTINPLRYDGMQYDLDLNNGHVQPEGAYHYHGFPYGLFNKIKSEQQVAVLEDGQVDVATRGRYKIVLLGWAFDGNPIYAEECGEDNASMVNAKSSWKVRTSTSSPPARTSASVPSTDDYPLADFLEDYTYDEALFDSDRSVQLDECNGHRGPIPEFPDGVYHYHILEKTDSASDIGFPYIGRCYRLFTYRTGPNIFPKETNPKR